MRQQSDVEPQMRDPIDMVVRYDSARGSHLEDKGRWLMALILSSETQMVRDTAHEFFRERAPITALRKLRDSNDPDGFSRGLWREMAELGWTGFLVPEDHGGTEFGVLGLAQVMEAAGRTLAASALVSTALVGASLLTMAGSEDQKSEHLPPLVAGERLFALALEEGSRHQPYGHRHAGGTGWRLGSDEPISFQQESDGLHLELPKLPPTEPAFAFRIMEPSDHSGRCGN